MGFEGLLPEVAKLGVLGLVIIGLIGLLMREWKANDRKDAVILDLQQALRDVQEKRVGEASASTRALEGNTNALQVLNATVRGLSRRGASS